MRFAQPQYLYLLLMIPPFIGLFIYAWQQRDKALSRFASPSLLKKIGPGEILNHWIIKILLFLIAFIFLVFALTRPQFGVKSEMAERKGVDVMVALDISKSMLAEDITPNRLDRAKHEIESFLDLLSGDRIGLIVFAGESFVQCPMTLDYGAAKMFLNAVESDWIQVQGTALGEAINQASESLGTESQKHKVLILITDGEDHGGETLKAAKKASEEGVKIYTVGIGSEKGVPIPVKKSGGNVIYKKDKDGNLVMTRLNPIILEKVALEGKGRYFHAETDLDLSLIYSEISKMEKKDLGLNKMTAYKEQYQIFLLIAVLLIALEFLIPLSRKKKKKWRGRFE